MMRGRFLLLLIVLLILVCLPVSLAWANDDIPDNCENTRAEYYRQGLFARYEPQNRRLVLMDWNTGAEVLELATNLEDTLIRGWSWNCHYLAVATGDAQSRATVVYDTATGIRLGEVADAHIVPHTITWGPGSFLVVETRTGAILWDVEQNRQYQYATGFHTTLHRNFTQLRWDTDNHQLIANLAVGGRLVIDLNTGQETVIASRTPGEIVIGGETFYCQRGFGYDPRLYAHTVSSLYLDYSREGGVVYLARGRGGQVEVMATIESHVDALSVRALGWSANCRYLAATIGVPGQDDVWQTVVWEFETRRRVGSFDDAHDIPHPITWDTAEKHLLVRTRNGAYLWNLETDARILVTDYVEQVCSGYYACSTRTPKSFHSVYWDAGREQLLAVPLNAPNAVVAYDVNTGAEAVRYTIDGASRPLQLITSNDSRLLITYSGERLTLWNRDSGTQTDLDFSSISNGLWLSAMAISTDNHYLAYVSNRNVYVWDLSVLTPNMPPTTVFSDNRLSPSQVYFVNGDTLDMGSAYLQVRINVTNGQVTAPSRFDPEAQNAVSFNTVNGTSGYGLRLAAPNSDCPVLPYRDERLLYLHNIQTDELRLIADDINIIRYMNISPDCRTLYTEIQLLNTSLPYDETPGTVSRSEYRHWVKVIFWDIESGEPFLTFEDPAQIRTGRSRVWWSPDGERALFSHDTSCCNGKHLVTDNHFIIDVRQQTAVPMHFMDTDNGYFPSGSETYWDYSRGVIFLEGYGEVFAFDMLTGAEQLRFSATELGAGGCYYNSSVGCQMQISDDLQWMFVFGNSSMGAWNIDTLQHAFVPVASGGRQRGGYVSPDGRYLIIARSAVRVWDLSNLPDEFASREPFIMFGFGAQRFVSLRFVNNTIIEIVIPTDNATETVRYDIITGDQVHP